MAGTPPSQNVPPQADAGVGAARRFAEATSEQDKNRSKEGIKDSPYPVVPPIPRTIILAVSAGSILLGSRNVGLSVFERIVARLQAADADYRHLEHEPTKTSEDAARVRGESTKIGGKALVFKADGGFRLLVISAARQVKSSAARRAFESHRLRFATAEELADLTGGLVPGSVPPFGEPILPLPLYVDRTVMANERIAFNAGSLTDSIIMWRSDWQGLVTIEKLVDVARPDVR